MPSLTPAGFISGVAGAREHQPCGRGEQRTDQREVPPHQLQEREDPRRDQVEHRVTGLTPLHYYTYIQLSRT